MHPKFGGCYPLKRRDESGYFGRFTTILQLARMSWKRNALYTNGKKLIYEDPYIPPNFGRIMGSQAVEIGRAFSSLTAYSH